MTETVSDYHGKPLREGVRVTFPIGKTVSGVGTVEAIDGDMASIRRNGKLYTRPAEDVIRSGRAEPADQHR